MHAITEPGTGNYDPADASTDAGPDAASAATGRRMVPVSELTAHPGNVREDLQLTGEFTASVAAEGVRIPLLITTGPDGGWRVIEGHRRLAAAVQAGLAEVPCDVDPGRAGDDAGQYLDMLLANSDSYRANYRAGEEAAALFAAHEAGASRTRLRKATGRSQAGIKAALAAGALPAGTRTRAEEACREVTLEQLAVLAEFDGDADATSRLVDCLEYDYPLEHAAERIRRDRADAAAHAQLRADLDAAGISVTDELPAGAAWLTGLTHDGQDLSPELHAACPGRGATFKSWSLLEPHHYCADPAGNGHASRDAAPGTGTGTGSTGTAKAEPDPDRRLVITGNKAWQAAAGVRHRWITDSLLARRSVPREVHVFIARQLLAMPAPLRANLAAARDMTLFSQLTARPAEQLYTECDIAPAGRLAVLALAPIIAAFEHAMTDGDGRNTWRADRYSPCPRGDAGAYLAFLASLGYQLAGIEQAVAGGIAWTGDTPLTDIMHPAADSEQTEAAA